MSNLTKSKIAYDLNISPHRETITYSIAGETEEITFIFSSNLYRTKWRERFEENRSKINESLTNRFGFDISLNQLADIKLYSTIEKRGFLLYKGPVKVECLNDIILNGLLQMKKR